MLDDRTWLQKLNQKFGRWAIRNLMTYIVFGMAVVFMLQRPLLWSNEINLYSLIEFDPLAIMRGQVWRIITFIFESPSDSLFFVAFVLYFYWMIGSTLENEWGAFKFNIFYLTGIIGTIIGGLITGYATNIFLNASLFFAFALLYPNYEIMIFFILPVKIKYIALIDAAFYVIMFIFLGWSGRLAIVISLINLALFFWRDAVDRVKYIYRRERWKRNFR